MTSSPRLLIIQLTRIGDLIQTVQASRQFKSENPNFHLTIVARRKFASELIFLLETVFDDIILFDTKDFFIKKDFKSACSEVHTLVTKTNETPFDYAINLSFCKSSSYLNSLIQAEFKFGIHRNDRAEVSINDKWSQFIYSNVLNTADSPFSLVDIYRYIMGVKQTLVLEPDQEFTKRDNNIVIHPFASQRKKRWGLNRWSELIFKLIKDKPDHTIHIVGSSADHLEAQRLLSSPALKPHKDNIITHTQDKKIVDTYQLLMNSKLFIGHDSMVSHLASETLTPSIVVSLGTVRPYETSPYSNSVINVAPRNKCFPCTIPEKCELLPCHNSINHQVINSIALGILREEEINQSFLTQNLTPFHLNGVQIFKGDYDDNGFVLNELTSSFKSTSDAFKAYYKIIWLYYLNGAETAAELPSTTKETADMLNKYLNGVNYLFELYNFGVKYSNKIISESESENINFQEIQESINKLGEIDNLCNITKKSFPLLKGLVDFFYVNKANALGDNLKEISQHNLLNYYDASNLVAVLNDFIERSVKPHVDVNKLESEV
jgi:ADP-heptose:LPS heptosyltransferase